MNIFLNKRKCKKTFDESENKKEIEQKQYSLSIGNSINDSIKRINKMCRGLL